MADLNPIDAAKIARSTGNFWAVLADPGYLAPMRDGQYRLREPLPDGLRRSVLRRDRLACCDCRQAWSSDRTDLFLQVDHVVPVAAGGTDRTDNLRTLCEDCNQDKLDRYTIAVASSRPRLIVSWCYDCAEPDIEVTEGITARVFCATCRKLKSLHPDDAEDRERARYFKRA